MAFNLFKKIFKKGKEDEEYTLKDIESDLDEIDSIVSKHIKPVQIEVAEESEENREGIEVDLNTPTSLEDANVVSAAEGEGEIREKDLEDVEPSKDDYTIELLDQDLSEIEDIIFKYESIKEKAFEMNYEMSDLEKDVQDIEDILMASAVGEDLRTEYNYNFELLEKDIRDIEKILLSHEKTRDALLEEDYSWIEARKDIKDIEDILVKNNLPISLGNEEQPQSKGKDIVEIINDPNEPFEEHYPETMENGSEIDFFNENFKRELVISNILIKRCYSTIRNLIDDYDFTRLVGEKAEDYYSGDKLVLRITLFNRSLRLYLNLDPEDVKAKYNLQDYSEHYGYKRVSYMFKVNSLQSLKYAMELIRSIIRKYEIHKKIDFTTFDYVSFLTDTSYHRMLELGYDKTFFQKETQSMTSEIKDEDAINAQCLERDMQDVTKNQVVTITIGELSYAFSSEYVIDLDLLKEIGLAPKSATYLKIVYGGRCTKKLTIKAHEFDLEVLKMILLQKGNAYKMI